MMTLMQNGTAPPGAGVSDNIRAEIARQKGVTGVSVARAIGMRESTWRKRVGGRTPWYAHEVEAIARILGVPVGQLYGEK
jgi:hypothetical protein